MEINSIDLRFLSKATQKPNAYICVKTCPGNNARILRSHEFQKPGVSEAGSLVKESQKPGVSEARSLRSRESQKLGVSKAESLRSTESPKRGVSEARNLRNRI